MPNSPNSIPYYCRHNKTEVSIVHGAKKNNMVMGGPLEAKLPPALTISSADLRVLDPIGQGIMYCICIIILYSHIY